MGGSGSGRWHRHDKADTVEECLALDANQLVRDRLIQLGIRGLGTLTWSRAVSGEIVSRVGFEVDTSDRHGAVFGLRYTITRTDEHIQLPIRLEITHPYLGGTRWWFTCPLIVRNVVCNRRVAKLYLPPGGRYFGCRRCYGLTYRSCQESDKRVSALRRNPVVLAAALQSKDPSTLIMGIRARWGV